MRRQSRAGERIGAFCILKAGHERRLIEARRSRLRLRQFTGALCFFVLAIAAAAAWAQTPQPDAAPPPTETTPAQAQQAIEVLQDPEKRAALIETLQTIAKAPKPTPAPAAAPATAPATPAPTPAASAPTPAAAPAVAPIIDGGLGARLLLQASNEIDDLSRQFTLSASALMSLPLLWRWLVQTATDSYSQTRLLDFLMRAVIIFGGAVVVEHLVRLALRRPFAALEARASHRSIKAANSGEKPSHEAQTVRTRRFLRLKRILGRAPYALARLVLEIAPIVVFAIAGNLLLATQVGEGVDANARLAILSLIKAYIICRTIMSLTRAFACDKAPATSLFILPRDAAAYLETWMRRIVGLTIFGVAFAHVGLALGMHPLAYEALVKFVVLISHLLLVVVTLQCRQTVAALIRAPEGRTGFVSRLRNHVAAVWHYFAIFANLALWTIWALHIQNGYDVVAYYAFTAIVTLALARAATIAALGGMDRLTHVATPRENFREIETRANRYYPAVRSLVSAVITFIALMVVFQLWGFDAFAWFRSGQIGATLVSAVLTISVAVIIALAIWESCDAAIERHLASLSRSGRYARAARLTTLLPTLRTVLALSILIVVGMTALSEIGVNIAPLLAGAGIVGIAVGFGSQKLVQDVITGLFLLLENAMQVGDFVTVAGLSGTVEYLSIRTIRLRASDGSVHVIPFSSVTTVTNANRGVGNAAVSVNLAFDEDTDKASHMLVEIAAEMRKDKKFGPMMRGDLALWGVDKVDGSMTTIVGQIECTDSGRWPVQREFNRRMKIRFQEKGVAIAYPGQTRLISDEIAMVRSRFARQEGGDEPSPITAKSG
jgi:moderate conductance mechanosensitive channel